MFQIDIWSGSILFLLFPSSRLISCHILYSSPPVHAQQPEFCLGFRQDRKVLRLVMLSLSFLFFRLFIRSITWLSTSSSSASLLTCSAGRDPVGYYQTYLGCEENPIWPSVQLSFSLLEFQCLQKGQVDGGERDVGQDRVKGMGGWDTLELFDCLLPTYLSLCLLNLACFFFQCSLAFLI